MNSTNTAGPAWIDLEGHFEWLKSEEQLLITFHEQHALKGEHSFAPLDRNGQPDISSPRELYATARLVHCFSIAHLKGRPGSFGIAEFGLRALNGSFIDDTNGGWYASISADGDPVDNTKSAYAHAFVLLAASSALQAGIPGADELFACADRTLDQHFWDEEAGAVVDAFTADWILKEPGYRGQNANMHLTEAYLAAYEAVHDVKFLRRAERIAEMIVLQNGPPCNWRIPEHFDASWTALPDFNIDKPADPFRPYGSLVGHWFEWARLILQLHAIPEANAGWAPEAARQLFAAAIRDGWDVDRGGIVYSVDFSGRPVNTDRMHWAIAEAVGAAVYLYRTTGNLEYEGWYRKFWSYIREWVVDRVGGSWWHQLDVNGRPTFETWSGKPDLYHAYQATLYARADLKFGLAAAAREGRLR